MFYVVCKDRTKHTFKSIDELFAYVNTNDVVVEGFAGYKV